MVRCYSQNKMVSAEFYITIYTINPICLFIVFIITQFISYIKQHSRQVANPTASPTILIAEKPLLFHRFLKAIFK